MMPGSRRPGQLPNKYETDEDGLPREIVGRWVEDKHARLQKYIGISRAVRKKFIGPGKAGATYIELYCGPGRVRVEGSPEVLPGSPLVAWGEAVKDWLAFVARHARPLEFWEKIRDAGSQRQLKFL